MNCALSQAKDKEERLLKRQKNRERMEEQHKQKSVRTEEQGISVMATAQSRRHDFGKHLDTDQHKMKQFIEVTSSSVHPHTLGAAPTWWLILILHYLNRLRLSGVTTYQCNQILA